MATKAKTISARAIAIAAIGSLALGGAQVVAPAGSVLAAGVTEASAQTAERDVTKNVTADGLYYIADGEGYKAGEKVRGNALPGSNLDKSAEHRFTLTVGGETGLTAGDTLNINIAPVKNPALPDRNSAVLGFINGQNGDIRSGDTVVGEWSTGGSGRVSVKMTEGAGEILTETPVTFTVASTLIPQSVSPEEIESLNGNTKHTQNGVQYNVISGKNTTPISVSGFTVAYNYYAIPDYTHRNMSHFGELKLDTRGDAASIKSSLSVRAARADEPREWIELVVRPRLGDSEYYNAPFADYTLIHPNELLDPNNIVLTATEKDPEGKERAKKVDTPQGMDYSTRIDKDGNLVVRFTNVPAGISPTLYFKNALVYDYTTPEVFAPEVMRTDNVRTEPYGPFGSIGPRFAVTGSDVDNPNPKLRERKGSMRVTVNGSEAPQDAPQAIGGTTQKFTINLYNDGNTTLSAPVVTFPDGKTKQFSDVVLSPKGVAGDSTSLTVDFAVPSNAAALNWKVSFPKVDPITFVNYVVPASQSDSVKDSFGYPTDKPVTVEQEKTVKSPAPKGAPKDTKYRIDRTTNPNLTWTTVDPNTGVVTLSPSSNVVPGNYEVPVEATFPDGSNRIINLPVLVTGEDPADRVKDLEDQIADLEKELDEEKKKSNADREKIARLERDLENAKDAAKAAQDSANNAQDTANQALKDLAAERERVNDLTKRANQTEKDLKDARERVAALEKENDAQQKQIDQARQDVKDLQGKTKQLRADLTAAEKRVSTLEAENKKQQGQIDALVKENKTQQSQIDALKKQNGEQQKQIDGLKAGLRDANKKITALETDLALTKIELAEVSGRLAEVEDRLNTGLGKCVGTIGGSLAALVPAVILASQFTGGTNIPQVDNSIAQFQRQLGMFNPQLAQVVDQNRGAIAAGLAGLGLLSLVLLPGTCGDASLGGAVMEPLSSARAERKAARENGEGGSSLKAGADVAAGEGAGSSEQ